MAPTRKAMKELTVLELVRLVRAGLGPNTQAIEPAFEAAEELERRAELEERLSAWQRKTGGQAIRFVDGSIALTCWRPDPYSSGTVAATVTGRDLESALQAVRA